MLDGLEGWHIVIIVAIAAVLFGSGKLPGAARSMGQSLRIFKSEMKAAVKDEEPGEAAAGAVPDAAADSATSAPTAAATGTPAEPSTPGAVPQPFDRKVVTTIEPVGEAAPENVTTQQ